MLFGQDLAADAVVLFEQQHVDGLAVRLGPGLQVDCSCQPGDTAADDDYFWHNFNLFWTRIYADERQIR